jgi:dihydrofolate reductase
LHPATRRAAGPPSESRSSHDHSFRPLLPSIVATDLNNGIGIRNTLPWHLPEDLAHFKHLRGMPILMGRKTFESIGRRCPTAQHRHHPQCRLATAGVETAASLHQDAAALAQGAPAFIIGGAQIYAEALPLVDRLIITRIARRFDCDAFFPAWTAVWQETARENHHPKLPDWTTLL